MSGDKAKNFRNYAALRESVGPLVCIAGKLWRNFNGDAAYERYLRHWQEHHQDDEHQPLNRKAFFAAEMQRKWSGIKRCC